MDNELYWVWLTSKKTMKANKITSLLEKFNTVEEIYAEKAFLNVPNIGSREFGELKDKSLTAAKKIIEETHKAGAYIITFDDERYPNKLKNIANPPYILYCRGDFINVDDILTIAVVGTRRVTDYGRIVTSRLSRDLAKSGAVVVSGMARGVDTIAAKNALKTGAKTIAVLGCGIDIVYPSENGGVMQDIANNGMVITEYAPGSPPIANHFPERNRIIAGLSNGVLVTDAPKGSGSLITAKIASENGRDVFAVPRGILDENSGANRIIQQGAKLVMSCSDIIEEYPYMERVEVKLDNDTENELLSEAPNSDLEDISEPADFAEHADAGSSAVKDDSDFDFSGLSDGEREIAEKLALKDMQIDELASELDTAVGTLNTRLTLLEVKGVVKKLPGGFYKINTL
ncbi:MAG: DNA-processing protein DprA [Firmicutes bacterium]|nr:DNA-processing protein DprA [Bacillota bacterium]